jgi:omega-hydroxy-beta-dihydromenaquinone-9 sulfotransferase
MFSLFNYPLFFRIAAKSFLSENSRIVPLTPKRIVFLICFFLFFPIFQLINAIFFKLDDFLFPEFRHIQLKPPVFIIGNGRSGTTHLHRLLALDENHFFYFKTWEILFPSIFQKKILSLIGHIDSLLGSPGFRFLEMKSKESLDELSKAHATGLFVAEECETLLFHIFSSYNLIFFFPYKHVLDNYLYFDELLSSVDKKRVMTFYRECVIRQAYFKGNKGMLISKSPGFTSKIDSLRQFFPGCKIVYMIRSPFEVVPSLFSLVQEIYNETIQIHVDTEILDGVYRVIANYYDAPLKQVEKLDPSESRLINYHELAKSPYEVVAQLYHDFNFDLSSDLLKVLQHEDMKAKRYVSKHQYSLTQFNLQPERIAADFKEIINRFGFEMVSSNVDCSKH